MLNLKEGIKELSDILGTRGLALFAGAGISMDSGLPSWNELLDNFMVMAQGLSFNDANGIELKELILEAQNARGTSAFDPIRIATVIKTKIKECDLENNALARMEYQSWLTSVFMNKRPNLKHELIVTTNYSTILTSNYDLLLESAANTSGFSELSKNSFTYKEELKIMSSIYNHTPSIIHVHGSVADLSIDQLIFTKEDYNKIILKKYSGFSFAMRMIFTRFSTLFVGYGASDPHLEEIFEEISEYFPLIIPEKFPLPYSYLVVSRRQAGKILQKYKERVRTKLIVIDDYKEYEELLLELRNVNPRT